MRYLFCLPETNAPHERVFSLMNKLWISERTKPKLDTLKIVIMLKLNVGSCKDFYTNLCNSPILLKKNTFG